MGEENLTTIFMQMEFFFIIGLDVKTVQKILNLFLTFICLFF